MKKKEKKPYFKTEIECPQCATNLIIKVERNVITPGTKAEVELTTFVEKSDQTKLE